MTNPLISIIMPVYNGERYISEAIESVLSQIYQNFELIIVNDGSTDNTKIVIAPYLKDPRIHYFEQQNAGVSVARNTAINKSQGDLIAFIDHDDLWQKNKLKTQVEYLETHNDIFLVYSDYEIFDEVKNEIGTVSDKVKFDLSKCDFSSLFIQNRIGTLTVLTYKRCILSSERFTESLKGAEDYELWLKIALQYKLAYQPEVLAVYRWHGTNTSKNELKMLIFEARALIGIIKKYPLSAKLISKKDIRHRLFDIYQKIGDLSIKSNRDRKTAFIYYIYSLTQEPQSIKVINKILTILIPFYIKRFMMWQYRKLKKIIL